MPQGGEVMMIGRNGVIGRVFAVVVVVVVVFVVEVGEMAVTVVVGVVPVVVVVFVVEVGEMAVTVVVVVVVVVAVLVFLAVPVVDVIAAGRMVLLVMDDVAFGPIGNWKDTRRRHFRLPLVPGVLDLLE